MRTLRVLIRVAQQHAHPQGREHSQRAPHRCITAETYHLTHPWLGVAARRDRTPFRGTGEQGGETVQIVVGSRRTPLLSCGFALLRLSPLKGGRELLPAVQVPGTRYCEQSEPATVTGDAVPGALPEVSASAVR